VPTELNVTNVARKTARKVREQHSDARINVFLDPGTNATASPKLSEAVEELLVNAVVHNDADQPTVNLRVTQQPDAVEMTISDNGPGIPENERDVLRHDSPPDQLFHGRGLGLWLARWIIAFSRGTISIEENRSCGATVKIRLTNKGQRPKLLTPAELD
jgi:signal transduction histidine kinase